MATWPRGETRPAHCRAGARQTPTSRPTRDRATARRRSPREPALLVQDLIARRAGPAQPCADRPTRTRPPRGEERPPAPSAAAAVIDPTPRRPRRGGDHRPLRTPTSPQPRPDAPTEPANLTNGQHRRRRAGVRSCRFPLRLRAEGRQTPERGIPESVP